MISLSTRFLAQPREMRLTFIMRRKDPERRSEAAEKRKNGGHRPPLQEKRKPAWQLFLLGRLGLLLLAFEIGGAAFAFDVLVQLLAHGWWKNEGALSQAGWGKSRTRSGCIAWSLAAA